MLALRHFDSCEFERDFEALEMEQNMIEHRRASDTIIRDFQVFGERRSGTNFCSALFASTFDLTERFNYGWKHGAPVMPCISPSSLIVVVVRDPYEWVLSMHARPLEAPRMQGLDFSDFIRSTWRSNYQPRSIGRHKFGLAGFPVERNVDLQYDLHPIDGRPFNNVLEMRRVKLRSHLGLLNRAPNVVVLKYEVLCSATTELILRVATEFGLQRRSNAQAELGHVGLKTGKNRLKISEIKDTDRKFIFDQLDKCLESKFGYC